MAGRTMPLWVAALTMTATWVDGGYLLGTTEGVYKSSLQLCIQGGLCFGLSLILGGLFFAGIMRRHGWSVACADIVQLGLAAAVPHVLDAAGGLGACCCRSSRASAESRTRPRRSATRRAEKVCPQPEWGQSPCPAARRTRAPKRHTRGYVRPGSRAVSH